MSLYKILFSHHAPKDSMIGIVCYLFANSDEHVYEWIKSNPRLADNERIFNSWEDNEADEEIFDIMDEKFNTIGTETFKEKIIRLKGEMNDNDYDFTDAYYGITLYGWEWVDDGINSEMEQKIIDLNIAYRINN